MHEAPHLQTLFFFFFPAKGMLTARRRLIQLARKQSGWLFSAVVHLVPLQTWWLTLASWHWAASSCALVFCRIKTTSVPQGCSAANRLPADAYGICSSYVLSQRLGAHHQSPCFFGTSVNPPVGLTNLCPPLTQTDHNDHTAMFKGQVPGIFLCSMLQNSLLLIFLSTETRKGTEVPLILDWCNPERIWTR